MSKYGRVHVTEKNNPISICSLPPNVIHLLHTNNSDSQCDTRAHDQAYSSSPNTPDPSIRYSRHYNMLSRPLLARRFRPSALSPSRSIRTLASSTLRTSPSSSPSFCLCLQRPLLPHHQSRSASHTPPLVRWLSSKSIADEKIEEITELYATAKDEVLALSLFYALPSLSCALSSHSALCTRS